MKILLMNSARTWGGTEKWTRMAAETLAEEHEVCLAYRREIIGNRFTVKKYRLPCLSHIDLYTLFRLVQIIRKERIDVIIPTKRKDYLLAGLAARACGITGILRLGIRRRLTIPLIHRLIYHTLPDGIIVNAEKIRQDLLLSQFMREENIKVIYNGVDTGTLERLGRPPVEKPYPFLVATAGVLTNRKGHDFLIRGFSRFLKLSPGIDAGLIIMGEGPKKEELQNLATELGVGERVVFTGFADNPYPWMATSDIFAMTSRNEGISNALLEAMYFENVPVSTLAGGTAELVVDGENGFLVEYGDEMQLAGIFLRVAENPALRRTIGMAARNTVVTGFTLAVMKRELNEFCIQKKKRKSPW
ncbi:MAG: glycosyltransferase [Chlorobiaceae bacterium]|nr:glycosyltransferase [Chlorobiaceae bacterium]